MTNYKEIGKCCLCKRQYTHWGNNALPIKDGRCCDVCNSTKVIPARFEQIVMRQGDVFKITEGNKKVLQTIPEMMEHPKYREELRRLTLNFLFDKEVKNAK